jgi:hypothetical protein
MNFSGMVVGVASSGRKVDMRWAMSLPALGAPVGMSLAWFIKEGPDRAGNRQLIAEQALKIGAPYLFFLDDDTICPNFTLSYLHAEIEKDPSIMVCGGIYCTKEPYPAPVVFKNLGGGPFYKWKIGEVFECAGLGTGAMLIKTEIFEKLERPWFFEPKKTDVDRLVDFNGLEAFCAGEGGTDDLYFCNKVTEAGFKVKAHGGVLPVHLDQEGRMYTLPLDSWPCQGLDLKELKQ